MKYFGSISLIILSHLAMGCATNTGTGVIAGTALGAGTGGFIGGGKGALIGGFAGAIGGGLIGAALDEQDRKAVEKMSPRTVDRIDRGDPLTLNDIIKLTQAGISDDKIIEYMEETSSTYHLSQSQVRRLHDSGVSQRVIDFMNDTGK